MPPQTSSPYLKLLRTWKRNRPTHSHSSCAWIRFSFFKSAHNATAASPGMSADSPLPESRRSLQSPRNNHHFYRPKTLLSILHEHVKLGFSSFFSFSRLHRAPGPLFCSRSTFTRFLCFLFYFTLPSPTSRRTNFPAGSSKIEKSRRNGPRSTMSG
ncbi:hypothetical protein SODALDRAFT_60829 [Sodiomyces alkalinus F11]|uniref:Uncharacterized protein n=1 Tax=Sodiomyces alkalinus (strain CBS 110278 / VKM F-3762 / F11) TaxID=1314773 RepID=A0A3N2PLA0_SODAK|nr:hypothetical protein SODALDRAFT_60829 [Sodiomyces alkalinus F11]ROT35292.1 hypothetical protein SODALDRAFT_60829 [Sodiomyces alkalinus F11]